MQMGDENLPPSFQLNSTFTNVVNSPRSPLVAKSVVDINRTITESPGFAEMKVRHPFDSFYLVKIFLRNYREITDFILWFLFNYEL